MRQSIVVATLVAGVWTTGCGDDVPGSPDAGSPDAAGGWPDLGEFDQPGDFPRDVCQTGSFDGEAIQGVYHLQIDFDGFVSTSAFRIDEHDDGTLGGVIAGRDGPVVGRDATDVILRYEDVDQELLRAIDLCARDADGTVHGTYQSCTRGQCYQGEVTGKVIDRLGGPVADGITLRGEFGADWPVGWSGDGLSVNVRVADNIAYVARYWDGLRIVDVSDPANMVELAHVPVENPDSGEIYNDVKIVDGPGDTRYALMASDLAGAVVVDVTTPSEAAIVAHFGTAPQIAEPINIHSIFIDSGKAYLANLDRGVEIWDVANPAAPVKLGIVTNPDDPGRDAFCHDLYVSGDRLYADWWQLGLAIVDVSNPAAPVWIGNFRDYGETSNHSSWVTQVGPRLVAITGDEQWGAHVHIVDVTEDGVDFGNELAEWETRPEVSVHNIMAMGDRAILSHYQDGVRVLDLSDPTAPTEIAHFDTYPGYDQRYGYNFFEAAVGIDLDEAGSLIYVADSHRGLLVLHLDR